MDSNSLFLTGNTDTVYAIAFLELDRDGPTVVEIPPGYGPGTVDDAWFRFVVDVGAPGPDRGQGGKYLILPPGYDGEVPEGYFVAQSTSFVNLVLLRGFMVDGSTQAASQKFRNGVKIYPLAQKDEPPTMEFINGSGLVFNTIHPNTFEFYEELHRVIDREPVAIIDPETRGLMAAIGIRKGKPFAPESTPARSSPTLLLWEMPPPGASFSRPMFPTTSCTRAATGSAGSSVATTGSSSTATRVRASGTSTHEPPCSTWPRSTRPR